MGFGGFLWGLGGFYGVWGHPSHPLSEFGGFWGHPITFRSTRRWLRLGSALGWGDAGQLPSQILGEIYGVWGIFMGFWGHSSGPLPEFGRIWGVLGSSHHLQVYTTMVGIFLVGLGSCWPNSVPDFGGNLWGLGGFMGFGVTSHILSQNLGGFGVIPSPSGLRNDGWDLPGWVGEMLAQFCARF